VQPPYATATPNLHDESAKAIRHFLRTRLLGLDDPVPVIDGRPVPAWILSFGIDAAVYRVVLFTDIALAVYHFFFKLLGIFLFVVEIWCFIPRPIQAEVLARQMGSSVAMLERHCSKLTATLAATA
jgi:putative peptide zinc metalloprotease protein